MDEKEQQYYVRKLFRSVTIGILLALPIVIYVANNAIQRSIKLHKSVLEQKSKKQNDNDSLKGKSGSSNTN